MQKSGTILAADDNPQFLEIIENSLAADYQIFKTSDPTAVIRLVGHYKPDVVLLDVEMPGLSGLEILQHLNQRATGLPVIMLTSESKAEVIVKAMRSGAFGAGNVPTDARPEPDDIITFLADRRSIISERIFKLYESGHSYPEIATSVGIPEGSIRHFLKFYLKSVGEPKDLLRKVEQRKKKARGGNSPYGFVSIHNELVEHPKEQVVVHKILDLWKSGQNVVSIARTLNARGISSRMNSKWHHKTVSKIIQRSGLVETKKTKARRK